MDGHLTPFVTIARRLSPRQSLSAAWERVLWRRRTQRWEEQSSTGLTQVVAAVVAAGRPDPDAVAVDLGCGSGQVTLPLAAHCSRVLAVDVNPSALALLETKAADAGLTNIQTLAGSIQGLDLEPASVDLVVTNYAMHHLSDADKRAALAAARRWLRPGGRLVIGDMMFGRGANAGDRAIITAKLRALAAKGPAGWWRIVKNVWRFSLRVQEMPLPAATWERLVAAAGFEEVGVERIVQEACVLVARAPGSAGADTAGDSAGSDVPVSSDGSASPVSSPGAARRSPATASGHATASG
ncbi:MAG TPA: class I SAM-dependent methyltransferase [Solirubrobacteraceae bacterium]|nr:class I SAM-dependent methyltransferase [Solirubrobacteraceae bacterium]